MITQSYAVSDVDEDGSPNRIACYWLNLTSPPAADVIVQITTDSEVRTDRASVTLDATNWSVLDLQQPSNFVCIYAEDDAIHDKSGTFCAPKANQLFGSIVLPGDIDVVVCGDHLGQIFHETSSSDPNYDGLPASSFRTNGPDLRGDSDNSSIDIIVRDDDPIGVILTESFAVTNLDEAGQASPVACYWVTLSGQPTAPVQIAIMPDAEVTTDKNNVTLTSTTWNVLDPATTVNRVCVYPVDDAVQEDNNARCAPMATTIFGTTVNSVDSVCGDHLGTIAHATSSADANYNALGAAMFSGNGPNFDANRSTVDVLLTNNDSAALRFVPSGINLVEGGSATYSVVLASEPSASVHVTTASAEVVFDPENWDVAQTLHYVAPDDNEATGPTAVDLVHSITSDDARYSRLETDPVRVTVVDDDSPGVVLSHSRLEVAEGGAGAAYEISLGSRPAQDVIVTVGADEQVGTNLEQLLFTPASWQTPQIVRIGAIDDDVSELEHAISHVWHRVQSADEGYDGLVAGVVEIHIEDNDEVGVSISNDGGLELHEDGRSASYMVVLQSAPTSEVTVYIRADTQTQTEISAITFDADDWNRPRTVVVEAVDDSVVESNHTSLVSHQVISADQNYNMLSVADVAIVVGDNDRAGVEQSGEIHTISEDGNTTSYALRLTSEPQGIVYIDIATDSQVVVDAHCQPNEPVSCLEFNPSNWNRWQTVNIQAVDDGLVEEQWHVGEIRHSVASTDQHYSSAQIDAVMVSILDNDSHNQRGVLFLPFLSN